MAGPLRRTNPGKVPTHRERFTALGCVLPLRRRAVDGGSCAGLLVACRQLFWQLQGHRRCGDFALVALEGGSSQCHDQEAWLGWACLGTGGLSISSCFANVAKQAQCQSNEAVRAELALEEESWKARRIEQAQTWSPQSVSASPVIRGASAKSVEDLGDDLKSVVASAVEGLDVSTINTMKSMDSVIGIAVPDEENLMLKIPPSLCRPAWLKMHLQESQKDAECARPADAFTSISL